MAENETPLTEQGYSPKELLAQVDKALTAVCLLYTSPSPRDRG